MFNKVTTFCIIAVCVAQICARVQVPYRGHTQQTQKPPANDNNKDVEHVPEKSAEETNTQNIKDANTSTKMSIMGNKFFHYPHKNFKPKMYKRPNETLTTTPSFQQQEIITTPQILMLNKMQEESNTSPVNLLKTEDNTEIQQVQESRTEPKNEELKYANIEPMKHHDRRGMLRYGEKLVKKHLNRTKTTESTRSYIPNRPIKQPNRKTNQTDNSRKVTRQFLQEYVKRQKTMENMQQNYPMSMIIQQDQEVPLQAPVSSYPDSDYNKPRKYKGNRYSSSNIEGMQMNQNDQLSNMYQTQMNSYYPQQQTTPGASVNTYLKDAVKDVVNFHRGMGMNSFTKNQESTTNAENGGFIPSPQISLFQKDNYMNDEQQIITSKPLTSLTNEYPEDHSELPVNFSPQNAFSYQHTIKGGKLIRKKPQHLQGNMFNGEFKKPKHGENIFTNPQVDDFSISHYTSDMPYSSKPDEQFVVNHFDNIPSTYHPVLNDDKYFPPNSDNKYKLLKNENYKINSNPFDSSPTPFNGYNSHKYGLYKPNNFDYPIPTQNFDYKSPYQVHENQMDISNPKKFKYNLKKKPIKQTENIKNDSEETDNDQKIVVPFVKNNKFMHGDYQSEYNFGNPHHAEDDFSFSTAYNIKHNSKPVDYHFNYNHQSNKGKLKKGQNYKNNNNDNVENTYFNLFDESHTGRQKPTKGFDDEFTHHVEYNTHHIDNIKENGFDTKVPHYMNTDNYSNKFKRLSKRRHSGVKRHFRRGIGHRRHPTYYIKIAKRKEGKDYDDDETDIYNTDNENEEQNNTQEQINTDVVENEQKPESENTSERIDDDALNGKNDNEDVTTTEVSLDQMTTKPSDLDLY